MGNLANMIPKPETDDKHVMFLANRSCSEFN